MQLICIITEPFGVSLPLSLTCYVPFSSVDLGVPVCLMLTKSVTQLISLVQRAVSRITTAFPRQGAPMLMGGGSPLLQLISSSYTKIKNFYLSFF